MRSAGWQKAALWILGLATIAGFVILGAIDRTMYDAGGPGIIRFEFVTDRGTAATILAAWGQKGQDAAELSLWLDFIFLLVYGGFLVLAIRTAASALAERGRTQLAWLGSWLWWFAIAGMVFDVLEDIALLSILEGDTSSIVPSLATLFAVAKFVALTNCVIYLIVASVALLRKRESQRGERSEAEAP